MFDLLVFFYKYFIVKSQNSLAYKRIFIQLSEKANKIFIKKKTEDEGQVFETIV